MDFLLFYVLLLNLFYSKISRKKTLETGKVRKKSKRKVSEEALEV